METGKEGVGEGTRFVVLCFLSACCTDRKHKPEEHTHSNACLYAHTLTQYGYILLHSVFFTQENI